MTRPGRRESEIDPDEGPLQRFAHDLRVLRRRTGAASYQDLARHTRQIGCPFSASTLRNAASGAVLPTAAVVDAFVRACLRNARHHRTELADPAVLDVDAGDLAAGWVRRRNELAEARDRTHDKAVTGAGEGLVDGMGDAAADQVGSVAADGMGGAEPPPADVPGTRPSRRLTRRPAVLVAAAAAAAMVVAVLAAVIVVNVWPGPGPGGEDGAGQGADANAAPVNVASLPPELESGRCRGAFAKRYVTLNPCIKATAEGLEIAVRVTSLRPAEEIAVHLWLHDVTTDTRMTETLHYCQAAFTAPGQTSTCGPVVISPEPGHEYFAAAGVQPGSQAWPDSWRDPTTTGLTSPVVEWPAGT